MIFLGRSFLGGRNTADFTPTDLSALKVLTLRCGQYNNLFITRNVATPFAPDMNKVWDYDTVMNAAFNGTLNAGNVDYTVKQVSAIRIKRRKQGDYRWMTLFEIPIAKVEDFLFERFDKYASAMTDYDYALVPVMNNIEGNLNINAVRSDFSGVFVVEKEQIFHTELDTSIQSSHYHPTVLINTIGGKYPFVVSTTDNSYDSGSASGTFLEFDSEADEWRIQKGSSYRKALEAFLCNRRPKVLKFQDGRAWLVSVTDNVSREENGHPDRVSTTFQWVEIGDVEDSGDLYENGMIDVSFGSWQA